MSYAIFIDSTTDMPPQMAEANGFTYIPYIFTLDGKEYMNHLDWRELSMKDFYNKLRDGKMSTTAQVTTHRYLEAWTPALKEGKDVLYICLSSQLSKSYDQSQLAAREAMEEFPDRKVITIDSTSASMGQGLLSLNAARLRDEGKTLEEAAAALDAMKPKLQHFFIVDDLHHLRRGGRVSGLAATMGTMLGIKPILTIKPDGKVVPYAKARGRQKGIGIFLENMEKTGVVKGQPIIIVHSDEEKFAEEIKATILTKYPGSDVITTPIGPVIGTHTGPGTVALLYLGEGTRPDVS